MNKLRTIRLICLVSHLVDLVGFACSRSAYGKPFAKCIEKKNAFDCLKLRALQFLDTAVKDDTVYVINDFVTIGSDRSTARSDGHHLERNLTEISPDGNLDEQLGQKFYEYLSSRSIQLTIPGNAFRGRKKKDKSGGMLMMAGLAMAAVMAQLAMSKIAFLAGTALLTAKMALVLSAIVGLKKLVSGGGSGGAHEVIYATGTEHHGGGNGGYAGWQRSLDQNLSN